MTKLLSSWPHWWLQRITSTSCQQGRYLWHCGLQCKHWHASTLNRPFINVFIDLLSIYSDEKYMGHILLQAALFQAKFQHWAVYSSWAIMWRIIVLSATQRFTHLILGEPDRPLMNKACCQYLHRQHYPMIESSFYTFLTSSQHSSCILYTVNKYCICNYVVSRE